MKQYIQPQTKLAVCLPQSNVLLLDSGSAKQPGMSAPERGFEGKEQGLKYLI